MFYLHLAREGSSFSWWIDYGVSVKVKLLHTALYFHESVLLTLTAQFHLALIDHGRGVVHQIKTTLDNENWALSTFLCIDMKNIFITN